MRSGLETQAVNAMNGAGVTRNTVAAAITATGTAIITAARQRRLNASNKPCGFIGSMNCAARNPVFRLEGVRDG